MSDFTNHSDQELLELLKGHDHPAFNELYNRYALTLFYQVNQMLRDQETAKDIVQEIFITLWNKADNIRSDANLAGYLYVAARNRVFKEIQKGRTKNDFIAALAQYASEISTEMMDRIDERQLAALIETEIALLPPRMREIFELSRKGNLSHKEIARQLDISDQTVKKQVQRALRILRGKMGVFAPIGLIIIDRMNTNS